MGPRVLSTLFGILSMAEACGPAGPELETPADAGGDAPDTTEPPGGVRLLSDVSAPIVSDASNGLRPSRDGAGHAEPSDGSEDARDGALESDAAAFAFTSCAAVRDCIHGAPGDAECMRASSVAARALAEPVLLCESQRCAVECGASLASCNACLLTACASALVACVRESGCGDGQRAFAEECDDANSVDGDACTNACTLARCGDGIIQGDRETCDDGNSADNDACTSACAKAVCGDSHVEAGVEGCDDGNREPGDGCSEKCLIESCGDGVAQPSEECDEGTANADDAPCLRTCRINRCGDAKVCSNARAGCGAKLGTHLEACDTPADSCRRDCTLPFCGDGDLDPNTEACDDGNRNAFDSCSNECKAAAGHLLITEIVTRPGGAEMVEIMNPTPFAVALSDYCISDSHLYYKVAAGTFATGSGTDFAARFPDGATIGAGQYRVVSLANASGGTTSFFSSYGKAPDFELRPTANGASDDAAVPNMQSAQATPSIGASASLTDAGEPVILFYYRGGALVSDVDYLFFGAPSASNPVVDKTGVTIADATYQADTAGAAQHAIAAPGETGSIHRCAYSEAGEMRGAGNGLTGHDETSEDPRATFALGQAATERTPGEGPPPSVCKP